MKMCLMFLEDLQARKMRPALFLKKDVASRFVAVDPFPVRQPNPFILSLENGALIRDVRFQKGGPDQDDDAVVIELSDEGDPAISPFRYPPKLTTTISGG